MPPWRSAADNNFPLHVELCARHLPHAASQQLHLLPSLLFEWAVTLIIPFFSHSCDSPLMTSPICSVYLVARKLVRTWKSNLVRRTERHMGCKHSKKCDVNYGSVPITDLSVVQLQLPTVTWNAELTLIWQWCGVLVWWIVWSVLHILGSSSTYVYFILLVIFGVTLGKAIDRHSSPIFYLLFIGINWYEALCILLTYPLHFMYILAEDCTDNRTDRKQTPRLTAPH